MALYRRPRVVTEPVAVTLLVIDALEQLGVAYAIGGSLASTVQSRRFARTRARRSGKRIGA